MRGLDVAAPGSDDGWMGRDVRNGVRTLGLLEAVAWCPAPEVRKALAESGERTDDPVLKKVLPAVGRK